MDNLDAPLWIIAGKLCTGAARMVLDSALRTANIAPDTVHVETEIGPPLTALLEAHKPQLIVTFTAGTTGFLAGPGVPLNEGVEALRGYLWDTPYGRVLSTIHPGTVVQQWTPWRALLDFDMRRAARELELGCPPLDTAHTVIVTSRREADALRAMMRAARLAAVDIENTHDNKLACVAFASRPDFAYCVPARDNDDHGLIRELCESDVPKVLQNGQYDRFFLDRFAQIQLRHQVFDTQLAWHALNPELAGKKAQVGDRKAGGRRTVKSLRFLASIYLRVPYWKDYDFASEDEQYRLCGRDTAYTLGISHHEAAQLADAKLAHIHEFEVALLDPCIAMSQRGIRVDDERRKAMMAKLAAEREPLAAKLEALVRDRVLTPMFDNAPSGVGPPIPKLLHEVRVCKGCRNGKKKRLTCTVCGGAGKSSRFVFNPNSDAQVKIVLYDLLKLPKRTKDGKLRSDEETLKSLLSECDKKPEARELILGLLRYSKLDTMGTIFERIAPGADGRIRTFLNPAGTDNGRFSLANSFLIESTNLGNMPKAEVTEPDFDVRACFVPDEGCVFVEADLSGAEAWVTAACCHDMDLLDKLRSGFKIHEWTASYILTNAMKQPTTIEQVTPVQRQVIGKKPRHALNYAMQPPTFRRDVNLMADRTGVAITMAQSRQIYDGYHALHPKLSVWWDRVLVALARDGKLTTCFGRVRTFYGRDRRERLGQTHREAIACEPQSTVADLLNRGLLRWWRQHDGKLGILLLQVYDSVLIQCKRQHGALVAKLVRRCLTEEIEVQGVKITIPVDVKVCDSWAAMPPAKAREAA